MAVSHALYGLHLSTNIAIPALPVVPEGKRPVDVRFWLKERPGFPAVCSEQSLYVSPNLDARGRPVLRVSRLAAGSYFGFSYSDGPRFVVGADGREVWADWPENYSIEDAATYLVGPVVAFVLRLRGITCLHASAVAIGDQAIALIGSPGAGKSTTAATFAQRGYSVLSDDVVALDDCGDHFLAQPGYPRVNLWPDSVRALFGSEDALPRITPTWDKRFLALDQNGYRFHSKPLPLGAIYILGAPDPHVSAPLEKEMGGREALIRLVANTYVYYLLDHEMRRGDFNVLGRVSTLIPIRNVRRSADSSRPFDLCDAIASDARQLTMSTATPASETGPASGREKDV